jgi:hypothetical protein
MIDMDSQELYTQMKQLWETFEENHTRFYNKRVKAAGSRARKSILELKKLSGNYRTACLNEAKDI